LLEHYEKAAKALNLDIDKIVAEWIGPLVRKKQTREQRKKMKREMK
jgi:hypothetical protein